MADARVPLVDTERLFEPHELFYSTTDAKGVIRHGNRVFTRISGYSEEELVGSPHNIIRHPDMPRAAFQLLWDYLQAGKPIAAYVKNLAKDGQYYWVMATVMPCAGGYISIRLKPTSPLLATVKQVYRETLAVERRTESKAGRRQAIQDGLEQATALLKAAGFGSYDAFMWHALAVEMTSRQTYLASRSASHDPWANRHDELATLLTSCRRVEAHWRYLFESLGSFEHLNARLGERSATIIDMADTIYTLSLNATIASHRAGATGVVLAAAANELGTRTADNEQIIQRLSAKVTDLTPRLGELMFSVAVARLQSEICSSYTEELLLHGAAGGHARLRAELNLLLRQLLQLNQELNQRVRSCERELDEFAALVNELKRNARALRLVQFAGMKEALVQGSDSFAVVFREVRDAVQRTTSECDLLANEIASNVTLVRSIRRQEGVVAAELSLVACV